MHPASCKVEIESASVLQSVRQQSQMTRTFDGFNNAVLVELAVARHAAWRNFALIAYEIGKKLWSLEIDHVL